MHKHESNRCVNCKFFEELTAEDWGAHTKGMGDCKNDVNFYIGYLEPAKSIKVSGAVIEGDEGWGWHVGKQFGCIHFVKAGSF